jgi:molybdopterin-binding protein
MKISARNALAGTIVDIKKGATTAHVVIDANGSRITAAITNEAVEDLGLKVGGAATAVIKASDVLIAVA